MIEFRDVHLGYPYEQYQLLKGASFTLTDGLNTVIADSQSGKTSVCRLILKDILPTSGDIFVDGKRLDGITNANLDILYLPSHPVFFERRSILYNVEYPLRLRKFPKNVRRGLVSELCERLEVADTARTLRKLPLSERKRVALARGLTVPRRAAIWDDFFDDVDDLRRAVTLFKCAMHIFVTSNADLAVGNTVVLDGGVTVYQGDADGARRIVEELDWQGVSPRS